MESNKKLAREFIDAISEKDFSKILKLSKEISDPHLLSHGLKLASQNNASLEFIKRYIESGITKQIAPAYYHALRFTKKREVHDYLYSKVRKSKRLYEKTFCLAAFTGDLELLKRFRKKVDIKKVRQEALRKATKSLNSLEVIRYLIESCRADAKDVKLLKTISSYISELEEFSANVAVVPKDDKKLRRLMKIAGYLIASGANPEIIKNKYYQREAIRISREFRKKLIKRKTRKI